MRTFCHLGMPASRTIEWNATHKLTNWNASKRKIDKQVFGCVWMENIERNVVKSIQRSTHTWFCNSIECEMWGEHVFTIYRVISIWTDMQRNSKAKSACVCVLFKAKPFHLSSQSLEYWDEVLHTKDIQMKNESRTRYMVFYNHADSTGAFLMVFRLTSVTKKNCLKIIHWHQPSIFIVRASELLHRPMRNTQHHIYDN